MKLPVVLLSLSLLQLISPIAHADGNDPRALQSAIEQRNAEFAQALVGEDLAAVLARYDSEAMLMPEHAGSRLGSTAIAGYYQQWMAASQTRDYTRGVHEVLDFGTHAVETGQFVQTLAKADAPPYRYAGKYMVVWSIAGDRPRVIAELWGSDTPFDRDALPVIDAAPAIGPEHFSNDAALQREIGQRNALIGTLVSERKGAEHAGLFLPDAIYLTYYTPMRIGMAAIRDYFIAHERPGDVGIDAVNLRSGGIVPIGRDPLWLEHGFYSVDWRAGGDRGTVTGKSLNLWKRDQAGTLMLYRQAVNHD